MNRTAHLLAATLAATLTACPSADDDDSAEPGIIFARGDDFEVTIFDAQDVSFGAEDRRQVDVVVPFDHDVGATYDRVRLHLDLDCPASGLCDWWDRFGMLGVVRDAGGESEQVIELARFMTPYRTGDDYRLDITELRPLFQGDTTFRVFIDTWVGPGHQQGEGWSVTASLEFDGGEPDRTPIAVLPVYSLGAFAVGDPARPVVEARPSLQVPIPAEAGQVALRSFITGHGQGNAGNCAEFCTLEYFLDAGGERASIEPWREDCDTTETDGPQQGTWQYPRAGWCPGADVTPWVADISATPGEPLTVAFGMQDYENTCRPDAAPCSACSNPGSDCDYNYNGHTEPIAWFSSAVIVYR